MVTFLRNYFRVLLKRNQFDVSPIGFLMKSAWYHLHAKKIYAHHATTIRGLRNINVQGMLHIGTAYIGFLNKYDRTYFNIKGKLIIKGTVSVGKGCRLDICTGGVCSMQDCYIAGQMTATVAHQFIIGQGSAISWGCEFLDEDWHSITYAGKKEKGEGIIIGQHVWIGSHSKILKGVRIGNNSVVAANSLVTKSFPEENVLIAGNPARIVRRGISWK